MADILNQQALYHIAPDSVWNEAQKAGVYTESTLNKTLTEVGFIHLSYAHQVKMVADSIYHGMAGLVVLKINADKLTSPVKVEAVEGTLEKFPHLYGPLNLDAIEQIIQYPPRADGGFDEIKDEALRLQTDNPALAVATYDKIAGVYTQQYFTDLSDTPWIDKLLAYLPSKAKILDAGCGPGEFTKYLFGKGYDVTGIDLSEAMIKIARDKVDAHRFEVMDMRRLSFRDDTFNGLLAAYSLIHIQSSEVAATLREFYRVIKPGGYVLAITQRGEPDKIVDEPLMAGEKMFINFFTRDRISKYLHEAGFRVVYQDEQASQDPDSLSDRVIYTIGQKTEVGQ